MTDGTCHPRGQFGGASLGGQDGPAIDSEVQQGGVHGDPAGKPGGAAGWAKRAKKVDLFGGQVGRVHSLIGTGNTDTHTPSMR